MTTLIGAVTWIVCRLPFYAGIALGAYALGYVLLVRGPFVETFRRLRAEAKARRRSRGDASYDTEG